MTEQPPVARFTPGTRTALARADVWLLLDCPLGDPFSLEIWSLVSEGKSVDDLLDGLLAPGLRVAPAFALAEHRDGGVRILVRGAFSVRGMGAGGPVSVAGHSICADVSASDVEHLELCASAVTGDPVVPLVVGVVPADGVTIRFREPRYEPTATGALGEATAAISGADAAPTPEWAAPPPAPELHDRVDQGDPGAAAASGVPLAAVGGYERLFGDPARAGTDSAVPTPATPDREVEAATGAEASPPVPASAPDTVEHGVATWAHDSGETAVVSSAGVPESSSTGGIIEALPDFFGPLAGVAPEPPSVDAPRTPLSAVPPAPASDHPVTVPSDAGTPVTPRTVNRAQLPTSLVVAGPTVWAAWCPVGHPTQAIGATCRVCGRSIASQEPQEIARPMLGRLVVPGAAAIPLDSDLVLGREPHVPPGAGPPVPRLVVLQDPRHEVSGQHASITLNFWDVGLTDLGSTNGTEVVTPDGRRKRLSPNVQVIIAPKTRIILGEVLEMVFEATE